MFSHNLNKDELERLEQRYEEQMKNNPSSSSFVLYAEVLLKCNKIEKAISVLIKGLRQNKNFITARFLLGRAYYECWNIDLAIKELEKVRNLAPDHFSASELLIEIKKSELKYDEALKIANDLSFYYRGNSEIRKITDELVLLKEKKFKSKEENLLNNKNEDKKIKSGESFPRTHNLANIYISQGQYEKALDIMTELLFKDPNNLDYRENYNKVLHLLSRNSIG